MVDSLAVLYGLNAHGKKGALGRGWFEAAALIDVQAAPMSVESNLDRMHAAAMRGKGRK